MINLKNLAFASLFITTSAFAQNSAFKRMLLDDGSIGVKATSFQYLYKGSNMDFGYGVNYSKQISPVVGVQIGYSNTKLSNNSDTIDANSLTLNTSFNLTNVSVGAAKNILFYLSAGFQIMSYEDRAVVPNLGTGANILYQTL